jgi:uncharacterized membrane protein YfcA
MPEILGYPLALWIVTPLVIAFAYTIFGISGFGSTVIAVPILANWLPLTFLVPLMALLDLSASLFVGSTGREHISKPELKRLLPFMFVGIALGVTVLVALPPDPLKVALGVFATAVGLYSIFNPAPRDRISSWWSLPAGLIGGGLAAVFGAGGPLYVAYLSGRLGDKSQIRSTISALIAVSSGTRTVLYVFTGLLLKLPIWIAVGLLAPIAWSGLRLGSRIHLGLTQEQMRRVIGALLILTGTTLLLRTLL